MSQITSTWVKTFGSQTRAKIFKCFRGQANWVIYKSWGQGWTGEHAPISETIQSQELSPETVTLYWPKQNTHTKCVFWINLSPESKSFHLKNHRSPLPYLWSDLMVTGAITLLSKLGKATLVRNVEIPSFYHLLLIDTRALCLS